MAPSLFGIIAVVLLVLLVHLAGIGLHTHGAAVRGLRSARFYTPHPGPERVSPSIELAVPLGGMEL